MSLERRQQQLAPAVPGLVSRVEQYEFEPIPGYAMLRWAGKRPFTSTQYYPAQHKETYGPEVESWRNKLYWGDNLQVMSHLLKEFRGQVKLIYIDPPFDSKADYTKTVTVRGKNIASDRSAFEEKQYTDIWTNDEYLQFMYERLILIRELLSDEGSIFLHCDWHRAHYLKLIMDEVCGPDNFRNEIIWKRASAHSDSSQGAQHFGRSHDTILFYTKSSNVTLTTLYTPYSEDYIQENYKRRDSDGRLYRLDNVQGPGGAAKGNPYYEFLGVTRYWRFSKARMEQLYRDGRIIQPSPGAVPQYKRYLDEMPGIPLQSVWDDISLNNRSQEYLGFPTQKPEALLTRIVRATTKPKDIVFDCFMGSGTTQAAAMKLGRRFLGADINLGAVQIASKRLLAVGEKLQTKLPALAGEDSEVQVLFPGIDVYNVNNYDIFRNGSLLTTGQARW